MAEWEGYVEGAEKLEARAESLRAKIRKIQDECEHEGLRIPDTPHYEAQCPDCGYWFYSARNVI